MEQVAPSVDKSQNEEVMVQRTVTSGDRPTELPEGRGGTYPQSPNAEPTSKRRFGRRNHKESKLPDRKYDR